MYDEIKQYPKQRVQRRLIWRARATLSNGSGKLWEFFAQEVVYVALIKAHRVSPA